MSDLDLTTGDPSRADEIADAQANQAVAQARREKRREKREAEKKASGSSGTGRTRSRASASSSETGLQGRLVDAFTRLANMLEKKGDDELATAIEDEKQAMAQGLVSLTRSVTPLRGPLVLLISFLEPLLAFWRVGSILGQRLVARRQRVVAEREMMAAEAQQAQSPAYAVS